MMKVEIDFGKIKKGGAYIILTEKEDGWWENRTYMEGRWHIDVESSASVIRTLMDAWKKLHRGEEMISIWMDGELVDYTDSKFLIEGKRGKK